MPKYFKLPVAEIFYNLTATRKYVQNNQMALIYLQSNRQTQQGASINSLALRDIDG